MQAAFGTVIFVVVAVAAVIAIVSLVNRSDVYDQIGRGGLSLDRDSESAWGGDHQTAGSAAAREVAEEEVRQMVVARNHRRTRQGKAALDVDAEVSRLMAPAPSGPAGTADPELAQEVRQLVEARNARRLRQGKAPLDVEAEVARQISELGGGV